MEAVRSGPSAARRATLGALAAGAALTFDWGLHRAVEQAPFAPFALADRVVRLTPGSVATYMIDHLQHAAKLLLAAGCVAGVIAAGAVFAVVAARRPARAAQAFGTVVVIAGLLAPVASSDWGSALAAALTGATYGASLAALRALAPGRTRPAPDGPDLTRRRALIRLGEIVLAGGVLNAVGPVIGARSSVHLLDFARAAPARRRPFPRIAGLTPEVTSVADHYVVDIDVDPPVVDVGSWRLRVGGLVQLPLSLGFDALQRRFDLVSEYAVLTCVSNPVGGPLVGNSLWEGVRLRELLDAAGASGQAWGLAVSCVDGYTAGIPLAAARHAGSLVAIAQDGQPLTADHGFPCRLRIPGLYGMLNPKWVTGIRVVDTPFVGYWARQGWSPTGVVRTECRIDTPDRAGAGTTAWIAGIAWAGLRGISAVEVSTDAGLSWQPAALHQPLSPWAWTQWAYRWTPPAPGRYSLLARAIDGLGGLQDARTRPPHPSGASGYPTRTVEVT
jgi:DMSO/TMAO reductase YedYZ molybdopterin-dependent catalytic subunit